MKVGATGPDAHQRWRYVFLGEGHLAAEKPLLLVDAHVEDPDDPQRIGANLLGLDERSGETDEFVLLLRRLLELAVATAAGLLKDREARPQPTSTAPEQATIRTTAGNAGGDGLMLRIVTLAPKREPPSMSAAGVTLPAGQVLVGAALHDAVDRGS